MKKIMIIEDELDIRQLLKIFVELEGNQAFIPDSFDNLSKTIATKKPNVVIMDVNFEDTNGEMNGIDVLMELRKNPQLDDIYVILTSGLDYSHRVKDVKNVDFIVKPYMPDELLAKIK